METVAMPQSGEVCSMCKGSEKVKHFRGEPSGILRAFDEIRTCPKCVDPEDSDDFCAVCGHMRRDHCHDPKGTFMRFVDGLCSIYGCECSNFYYKSEIAR